MPKREKEAKVEVLRRLLIEGEESGFTDYTLDEINRELDREEGIFLDREESVDQLRLESLAAWEEYQRTGQSVPNKDVITWLDTWGTEDEPEPPACK
jgi:predicted transcriptional regulator